jgi:ketosteroid isomerase-like protein
MTPLRSLVTDFAAVLTSSGALEAMHRFYAEDVIVFENRELARAGRAQCLAIEATALEAQPSPPVVRVTKLAADDATGVAFLEYVVRFTSPDGRPMRVEQVAVQRWESGRIAEERFYYEGYVDEGDA